MREYWSCTKFANFIRGISKPASESFEGWDSWHFNAKAAYPFRYWLAETALDNIQKSIWYIPNTFRDIKHYYRNRFVTKTHVLNSWLPKGQYYDLDTRILNCLFDELVNFVEFEKAEMQSWSHPTKLYKPLFGEWRSATLGLAYLDWEISLKDSDEDGMLMCHNRQSEAAQWIKDAYIWWTVTRPSRPDPYEVSGYNALPNDGWLSWSNNPEASKCAELVTKIEQEYDDEDEAMLIELIKHRKNLWT